jgi:hypothetical protein
MLQQVVVGVIVVLAALYAVVKFMPAASRRRLVFKLSRRGQGKLAKMVDSSGSCGGGGSACDTCGTCEDEETQPAKDGKRVIKLRVER